MEKTINGSVRTPANPKLTTKTEECLLFSNLVKIEVYYCHFMHPALLAMAIPAISPIVTLEGFQAKSGLIKTTGRSVLEYLVKRGIGKVSNHRFSFSRADRMKVAILALQSGNDIETVSKYLTWQDFEAFASDLLNLAGYASELDLRFSKPIRMQIDVLGINYNSQLAIVADCKHWKRNDLSSLSSCAKRQAERASKLLAHRRKISYVIPIILTLHAINIRFVDGIPLVPVFKFNSFVEELPLHLSEMKVISRI
ncbi:MAG TPA: hypothetical protein VEH06_05655 [Candidatus Bathyarchaeia archaeon]|nr:hypothetical protein [Candidatus Bathyarchaeia archaeon]